MHMKHREPKIAKTILKLKSYVRRLDHQIPRLVKICNYDSDISTRLDKQTSGTECPEMNPNVQNYVVDKNDVIAMQ